MTEKVLTKPEMTALWKALLSPGRAAKIGATELALKIHREKWASSADVMDLLYLMDDRLDELRYQFDVERWCTLFDIPQETVFSRPRNRRGSAYGHQSLSAANVAALLIQLQRLGFRVRPHELVNLEMSRIEREPQVSSSELTVYCYPVSEHKMPPVTFPTEDCWRAVRRYRSVKTDTGYKLTGSLDENSEPVHVEIKAPKYREARLPKRATCEGCGYQWMKGDPESSASHRREHKKRMRYLEPGYHPKLDGVEITDGHVFVNFASPKWMHSEMYSRALAFNREFHYDFVQWDYVNPQSDMMGQGFLFVDEERRLVGACAFRLREGDGKSWWGLQWIWFAPVHRRTGLLARRWPALRQRFGRFHVEGPVSPEMRAFLIKAGDADLMEYGNVEEI
ncbi:MULTISPECIES: hypothetical protein [unclassified Ensifer]|uniref:hypothetical protein n=1 Tax=unclassified Ensifer TaxID=2633371 RepID=UPI000812D219|nr:MULTISPECIES: hypothetical protein [unclassified Ensifer]OCP08408.1 hypothetical protein BBX50_20130 [Ensifer sp. LC11]OCP09027.1 hypothetical protein BC374_19920 [Ensifer sp. LC13]OCP09810.1 hypothetical protein BC362_08695 [Ensifer sp. LC14]OCP32283.1 hypothetical protein BC364_19260 [Ensifer sp. LC499]